MVDHRRSGGAGKSRMALELCLRKRSENWCAGFLDEGQDFQAWQEWKPISPTLIVVDYADKQAEKLGSRINSLYEKSKQWDYPVRILLLVRDQEGLWKDQFLKANREVIEKHTCYDSSPLALSGLDDESLNKIILNIFDKNNIELALENSSEILDAIKRIDGNKRPLYAAIISEAASRGESVRNWDKNQLHREVLLHSKKIWEQGGIRPDINIIDKKHYNLLTFATLCNGIGISPVDNQTKENFVNTLAEKFIPRDLLPAINGSNLEPEFNRNTYRLLSDNPCDKKLYPLEPDILGEYFILDQWQDPRRLKVINELWKKAWELYPWGTMQFLVLLFRDFMDSKIIDPDNTNNRIYFTDIEYKIIDQIQPDNEDGRKAWANAVYSIITLQIAAGQLTKNAEYKTQHLKKADDYFNRLETLWNGFKNDVHISMALAFAALKMIVCNGNIGKLKEAAKYFNCMIKLWKAGYQNDNIISLVTSNAATNLIKAYERMEKSRQSEYLLDKENSLALAYAAYNQMTAFGKIKRFDKAVKHFKHLETIWAGFKNDKEISWGMVVSASKLATYYTKDKQFDEAVRYFNRLETLWTGFKEDKEISLELAAAACCLTIGFLEDKQFDEAVKYFNRLETLWNGFKEDKEVSLGLAKAAHDMITHYTQNKLFDEAVKYFNHLETLWTGFKNDKVISLVLANAVYNLTTGLVKDKQHGEAVKYFKYVETLWKSGYQDDTSISLVLVNIATHLTRGYTQVGQLDLATEYYEYIETLWRSIYQKDKNISLVLANASSILGISFIPNDIVNAITYLKVSVNIYHQIGNHDSASYYQKLIDSLE